MQFSSPWALLVSTLSLSGCVGVISGGDPPGGGAQPTAGNGDDQTGGRGAEDTGGRPPVAVCNDAVAVTPLRRLTRFEYNNTVRDLLGDRTAPADTFTADEQQHGFDNIAAVLTVSPLLAEQHETTAHALATSAVANIDKLLGCQVATASQDSCVAAFITAFGKRAFRRPLASEERDRYLAFYTASKTQYDFASAVRMVVEAFLVSPHFLYRVEGFAPGATPKDVALTSHEVATRLSYLFFGSMPDQQLFEAADGDQLRDKAVIATQARRLLADPRSRLVIEKFHRQWLELELIATAPKSTTMFPAFNEAMRTRLQREGEMFASHVVLDGDGRIDTLLRADFSFMDRDLAAFYGVAGPAGTAFERVALDPAQRSGVLTQAAILGGHASAEQGSPVARGYFVRDRLLCNPPPAPPPTVNVTLPPFDPTLTTRERFSQHRADPQCESCHALLDPVGLGFEHYDAVGLWRNQEAGRPVDATGEIVGTETLDGPFDGALELGARLAGSSEVESCVATQWMRFAYGRVEIDNECALDSLKRGLRASNGDVRELLIGLTQTDAFLQRAGEGI